MTADVDAAHPRPWLVGVLDSCVLAVLDRGDRHGYGIARALEEAGMGSVKGGTLYPLLARLETAGLVAHHWEPGESGPPRKCYALTSTGSAHLRVVGAQWVAFTERVSALLGTAAPGPTEHEPDHQKKAASR